MKKFLDWAALENELNVLAERIHDFNPDVIIGIGSSGMVLAPLLARRLNVENIASITNPTHFQEDAWSNANVLLVTGFFTRDIQNLISKLKKAKKIKTCSLYVKINNPQPDYFLSKVEEASFPWDH